MTPTVGRIVHFVQQHSPEHVPGVVCWVHPPGAFKSDPAVDGTLVNLGLWDPRGQPTQGCEGVPEDQTGKRANSWHWAEGSRESQESSAAEDEELEESEE